MLSDLGDVASIDFDRDTERATPMQRKNQPEACCTKNILLQEGGLVANMFLCTKILIGPVLPNKSSTHWFTRGGWWHHHKYCEVYLPPPLIEQVFPLTVVQFGDWIRVIVW